MEAVFQWVKSLAYYLILVSLLSNLIPNGKYDRYIRLFTGAVFILLVIRPLSGGLGLEEKMAYAYEKIRLKQDTSEFEFRLWGMEKERTQQVIIQYEAAVAQDIKRMAFDAGLVCKEARAVIESDPENEKFGQVKGLSLVLERVQEWQRIPDCPAGRKLLNRKMGRRPQKKGKIRRKAWSRCESRWEERTLWEEAEIPRRRERRLRRRAEKNV